MSKAMPIDADSYPILVIGNKSDLINLREVSKEQAEAWCDQNFCIYIETSAKEKLGVEDAFSIITEKVIARQPLLQ